MDVVQRSNSAPSTPTGPSSVDEKRSQSSINGIAVKGRKVQFPSDEEIVTKYFDAQDPWSYLAPHQLTSQSLVEAYCNACDNQGTKPFAKVLSQVQSLHGLTDGEEDLNLSGEKLDAKSCEALEEIFKRVRFRSINLESCNLDDEGASVLFDMIEYYESATHLNLANNKAIGMRGWQACCRMLKKTPCLQHLDLRNCGLSEQVLLILGRALRIGSNLISLRLERSGISSRALAILVAALKLNTCLQYLYLGDNKLCSGDAIQIGNLLRANSTLDLLDLRDNDLQDEGLVHISEALRSQPSGPGEGLKYLIISNNQMTSYGMSSLVEALPFTKSLRTVNLNDNCLGDEGIIKLKEGIITAPRISALGLRNCKISCQGAIAIADCFIEGDSLHRVDLRENDIAERGLMALYHAAQSNPNILRIDLNCNLFSSADSHGLKLSGDSSISGHSPSSSVSSSSLTNTNTFDCSSLITQINLACETNKKLQQKDEALIFHDQGLESPGSIIELFTTTNSNEQQSVCEALVEFRNAYFSESVDCYDDEMTANNQPKVNLHSLPRKPILRSSSLGSWDTKASQVTCSSSTISTVNKVTTSTSSSASINSTINTITVTPIAATTTTTTIIAASNNNSIESSKEVPVRRSSRFSVSPVPDSDSPPPPGNLSASSSSRKSQTPSPLLYPSPTPSSSYSPEPSSTYSQPDSHQYQHHHLQSSTSSLYNNISTTPSPTVSPLPPLPDEPSMVNDIIHNLVPITKTGPSEGKPKKRISFALPVDESIELDQGRRGDFSGGSTEAFRKLRDRRMSSPAVPNNAAIARVPSARPKIPSLKMYKILDGLDLRSSVPLSPTRLYQSLEFPDLISWKAPTDTVKESTVVIEAVTN